MRQGLAVLLGGERSRGDKWLRRFLISSHQSYLCNQYLVRRLEMGAFDHLLRGDVAKKTATGGMFDVVEVEADSCVMQRRRSALRRRCMGRAMWAAKY